VVTRADAQIFDILATMRAESRDVALITHEGQLHGADDVLGVVTWEDILEHGNLHRHMLPRSGGPR
jgi:CBS domain containing-hemolysin-like protein